MPPRKPAQPPKEAKPTEPEGGARLPDYAHEARHRQNGYQRVCGIDEAGRGPLAGPVVAAAVILPEGHDRLPLQRLNDSKQICEATREELYHVIVRECAWGVGRAEAAEIDSINIRQASWLAMRRAASELAKKFGPLDFALIDGLGYGPGPWPYEALVKGDARCLSIAAASVVAKVSRDRWMREYDLEYPVYGFASHKGYGCRSHLKALAEAGPCPLHRLTFAPVRLLLAAKAGSEGPVAGDGDFSASLFEEFEA